jgi:hypothetical protein
LEDGRDRRIKLVVFKKYLTRAVLYAGKSGVLYNWEPMAVGKTVGYERSSAGNAKAQVWPALNRM